MKMGDVINERYRIVRKFGYQDFGESYLSYDQYKGCLCTITFLPKDVDISSFPESDYLCKIVDYIHTEDAVAIVSDYVEGVSADIFMKGEGLRKNTVLDIMEKIGQAVLCLHNTDPPIVHMGLQPKNIIIGRDRTPVLIDYFPKEEINVGTVSTDMVGYSPPESYFPKGERFLDKRADIFAFGMTYLALRTGNVPDSCLSVVYRQIRSNPNLSRGEITFLMHCICRQRDKRFSSMEQVLHSISFLRREFHIRIFIKTAGTIAAVCSVFLYFWGLYVWAPGV